MKEHHRIFIAIPFDAATRNQYKTIIERTLKHKYPHVTWVIATEQIGPSLELSAIETFKAQNQDLQQQFTKQITESDVLIADLTHNNPNVHLELGVALTQNKNILRVSGRSISEVAFDIQNQDVRTYKNQEQLTQFITKYLDTFFAIKKLHMSEQSGNLYCGEKFEPAIEIDGSDKSDRQSNLNVLHGNCLDFRMRDGAVEVEFEFISSKDETDWFGIFFRGDSSQSKGDYRGQLLGSYLAYLRLSGEAEIVEYPGPQPVETAKKRARMEKPKHSLRLEVENNEAEIFVDDALLLNTSKLSHQVAAPVLFAAFRSKVLVYSAKMVCRDTIEWA
jgi:hypothetical protein